MYGQLGIKKFENINMAMILGQRNQEPRQSEDASIPDKETENRRKTVSISNIYSMRRD